MAVPSLIAWILARALTSAAAPAAAVGAPPRYAEDRQLARAIAAYANLNFDEARRDLRQLLDRDPPRSYQGKAHLYLALIALDSSSPDIASAEFRAALQANPAIDLPLHSSPKARLMFAAERNALLAEVERAGEPPPRRPAPAPPAAESGEDSGAPTAAPDPPTNAGAEGRAVEVTPNWASAPPPESNAHIAALALGGIAVAAAAVAIVGLVQVNDFNAAVSAANANPGNLSAASYASQRNAAGVWNVAWVICAAAGAVGLGAAVVAW